MSQSEFSQGTVAFLDILGFSVLVEKAEQDPAKEAQLRQLVDTLERRVQFEKTATTHPAVSEGLSPKWIFISDSIVISSLNDHGDDRDLAAVALKTIEVANQLLSMGYLIRGGISRGKVWQRDGNIFGSAYMEAYKMEGQAKQPRVQLPPAAEEAWKASKYASFFPYTVDEGVPVVDLYHPYYAARGVHYEDYFSRIDGIVAGHVSALASNPKPLAKWQWSQCYIQRSRTLHCS